MSQNIVFQTFLALYETRGMGLVRKVVKEGVEIVRQPNSKNQGIVKMRIVASGSFTTKVIIPLVPREVPARAVTLFYFVKTVNV